MKAEDAGLVWAPAQDKAGRKHWIFLRYWVECEEITPKKGPPFLRFLLADGSLLDIHERRVGDIVISPRQHIYRIMKGMSL